jgi:hypothetical protein
MVRIMFDSDDPGLLAELHRAGEIQLAATYADLMTRALAAQFGAGLLVIDRGQGDPMGLATAGDFERGALKPADAPAWWDAHHDRGDLTVYARPGPRARPAPARVALVGHPRRHHADRPQPRRDGPVRQLGHDRIPR